MSIRDHRAEDIAAVRQAFRKQGENCRDLGSPFVGRLCDLFAERLEADGAVARKLLSWPLDGSDWLGAFPLRVIGALHGLVLEKKCPALTAVFPPFHHEKQADELWSAVHRAMVDHSNYILSRLDDAPQTNEVRRAAALLPGFLTVGSITDRPLILSELGASAGLNLCWDKFGYRLGELQWGDPASEIQLSPEWTGDSPPSVPLYVLDRAGCDLAPINPENEEECTRLMSYLWADQEDRMLRTQAALGIARREQIVVEKADIVDWLRFRLSGRMATGAVHVIYHSMVWFYLSKDAQRLGESLIRSAGKRATADTALAWLRLEADG